MSKVSKALAKQPDATNLLIKFGKAELDLIKETITPGATQPQFNFFVYDCRARGLNPLKKQMYFVLRKTKNSQTGVFENKATHQVSIDGFRSIAESTGQLGGQTPVTYSGEIEYNGKKLPEYAEVGVYRKGCEHPFYGRAYFEEYVQESKFGPMMMWKKMPRHMIAKCAEALALRKAFPEKLAGLYTEEEMTQADSDVVVLNEKEIKAAEKERAIEVGKEIETNLQDGSTYATPAQVKKFHTQLSELKKLLKWNKEKSEEMKKVLTKGKSSKEILKSIMTQLIDQLEGKIEEEKGKDQVKEAEKEFEATAEVVEDPK